MPKAPHPSRPAVDLREFQRRKIPTGGGPTPSSGQTTNAKDQPSKGQRLWDQASEEAKTFWLSYHHGNKAEAIKDLEYATEESVALLRRRGRLA